VVAWGIGCGTAGLPGVYVSLAAEACWLDWVLACHNSSHSLGSWADTCNPWLADRQTPGAGRRSAGITRQYQACTVTWPAAAARLEEGQDGSGSEIPADLIRKVKGLPEKIKSQGKAKTTDSDIP